MGDEIDTSVPATTGAETESAADTNDTVLTGADAGTTGDDTNSETDANASDDDTGTSDSDQSDSDAGAEGNDTPPDTYADFVMPEGVTLDESIVSEATPIFKELGATQEQAQKLMDLAAKQAQAGSQKQVDDFNQLMSDWRTQSENDSEFGGEKFAENVKVAQSAITKYGTPELKQLLEDHGVGNHPEVVRFMVRIGHTLKEDVPGSIGGASAATGDRAELLYPKQDS